MYEDNLMNLAIRICEGLHKQICESNITIDELNEKIDVIMDALGLETEDKDQQYTEELEQQDTIVDDTENEEDISTIEEIETEDKTEETNESLNAGESKANGYELKFSTSAEDTWWWDKVEGLNLTFNTIDEVIDFLSQHAVPIDYRTVEYMYTEDKMTDQGVLTNTRWYTLLKL